MNGIFDSATDPLGIALKSRASQSRQNYALNEGWGHPMFGPLPDPQWDGFFQSLAESGVSRLGDNSVGEAKGMFPGAKPNVATYDPSYQTSAIDSMPSNHIGSAGMGAPMGARGESIASMDALNGATGGFTAKGSTMGRGRQFMKVRGQRGTNGSNISERS